MLKQTKHSNKYFVDNLGNVFSIITGELKKLKPILNKYGYYKVSIHRKSYLIHRLVA